MCKSLDEIKYNLTIDQVYLFYEKCLKSEIENRKSEAITLANALIYTSPSHDTTSHIKKQRMWNSFINALDWDKITKEPKAPDPDALISAFGVFGVPPTKKPKGGKK